jgi:hypothetical protein
VSLQNHFENLEHTVEGQALPEDNQKATHRPTQGNALQTAEFLYISDLVQDLTCLSV